MADPTSGPRQAALDLDGEALRDEGAAMAEHALDTRWRLAAEHTIRQLAASGVEFTSDDVYDRIGPALGSWQGGMGAMFSAARSRGEIRAVGYATSRRPETHARVVRKWVGAG